MNWPNDICAHTNLSNTTTNCLFYNCANACAGFYHASDGIHGIFGNMPFPIIIRCLDGRIAMWARQRISWYTYDVYELYVRNIFKHLGNRKWMHTHTVVTSRQLEAQCSLSSDCVQCTVNSVHVYIGRCVSAALISSNKLQKLNERLWTCYCNDNFLCVTPQLCRIKITFLFLRFMSYVTVDCRLSSMLTDYVHNCICEWIHFWLFRVNKWMDIGDSFCFGSFAHCTSSRYTVITVAYGNYSICF